MMPIKCTLNYSTKRNNTINEQKYIENRISSSNKSLKKAVRLKGCLKHLTSNFAFRSISSWYGSSFERYPLYRFTTVGDADLVRSAVLWCVLYGVCSVSIILDHGPNVGAIRSLKKEEETKWQSLRRFAS